MRLSLLHTLGLVAALASLADAAPEERTASRWEIVDIRCTAERPLKDPYLTTFGAVLTHEGGATMTVPGFFDGDTEYVLRVVPDREGTWTYRTFSNRRELAGLEGTVRITPSTKTDRHGAVRIDPSNRQRFSYEDGTPYFALSFELDWLFALDFDNPEDIPRTRQIIDHIKANGFNQVVMNVYAYDASWGEREHIRPEHNFARPNTFPYGGTNSKPNYTRLNLSLFRHLDRVLAHLHEKEIVAHVMIYVWNKQVNWAQPYTPADDLYFDYVVKRFQAYPNLVWDISKEALAYGRDDIGYITNRIDRLRNLDGHRRLVTVHDYAYCRQFPDKVDFISMQEWRPNLYNEMLAALGRHPDKPVLNIEHGGYEKTRHSIFNGAYVDAATCLDRAYQCLFAGTYATHYWQNAAWYEVVYDIENLSEAERPALSYYRHLAALFERYDFNSLKPAPYLYSTYALTDHRSRFLYYLPAGMFALEGAAPPELRGKTVRLTWFDPLEGTFLAGETRTLQAGGGAWTGFARPKELTSPSTVAILEPVE